MIGQELAAAITQVFTEFHELEQVPDTSTFKAHLRQCCCQCTRQDGDIPRKYRRWLLLQAQLTKSPAHLGNIPWCFDESHPLPRKKEHTLILYHHALLALKEHATAKHLRIQKASDTRPKNSGV